MTTPDLLKLCDEVLSAPANPDRFACGEYFCEDCGDCLACYGSDGCGGYEGKEHLYPVIHECKPNPLPILASALKKLVPYVEHKRGCCADPNNPCSCGLDSALSEITTKEI